MAEAEPLLKPRDAAAALGVSYATIKKWILAGSLKTIQTPGGHHRIPQSALAPLSASSTKGQPAKKRIESRERFRTTSGRNQLVGRIESVRVSGLMAEVAISIGGQTITSIITARSVREMQLKPGQTAAALIKSTEVMIMRP